MKLSVVVLNYLNWKDTIECVDSLLKQKNVQLEIIVVDNNSDNDSQEKLKKIYNQTSNIHLIKTSKNEGFARGNNIGIKYSLDKLKINNVFVTNNDVVFTDENYCYELSKMKINNNVGAIGTKIIGKDGINQNPYFQDLRLRMLIFQGLRCVISIIKDRIGISKRKKVTKQTLQEKKENESRILHGSAILLTSNFLNEVQGFYPRTFLYYEENILAYVFEKFDLEMEYKDNINLYHKEDQSSQLSFSNKNTVKKFMVLKSMIHALHVNFSSKKKIKKISNNYEYYYSKM